MLRSRRRKRSRRPVLRLVAGLVLLLSVAGGVWWLYRPGSGKASPDDANNIAVGETPVLAAQGPSLPATDKSGGARNRLAPPGAAINPSVPPGGAARDIALARDEQIIIPPKPAAARSPSEEAIRSAFRFAAADADPPDSPAVQGGAGEGPRPAAAVPGPQDPTTQKATDDARSGHRGIDAARRMLESGKAIEARHQLNALLSASLREAEQGEVRALLTRVADDTIFSTRRIPDDPLVESYIVQPGDRLLHIGRKFDVPYEVLMTVNGITDPSKLRANQVLKVPRGPFHAKIHKSKFRLDVYLGDLYIRSYRVGLGTAGGTPEGIWRVKDRLPNPTYYPQASAPDKRIIAPDDPDNPLGEHWIGLEGLEGDAKGRDGYGIHGTIEPESIGKAVSLGCIRMYNEDVAFLYGLLLPGRSTVTILP